MNTVLKIVTVVDIRIEITQLSLNLKVAENRLLKTVNSKAEMSDSRLNYIALKVVPTRIVILFVILALGAAYNVIVSKLIHGLPQLLIDSGRLKILLNKKSKAIIEQGNFESSKLLTSLSFEI